MRGNVFAGLRVAALVALAGCGSSENKCSCVDTAIIVRVPPERASSVIDVTPSGTACAQVKATCVEGDTSACTRYRILPIASGFCQVDIDFAMGAPRFSADAHVVPGSGCCGGFVADPPSAGEIDVPSASDGGIG
jgi:hypothetical protein